MCTHVARDAGINHATLLYYFPTKGLTAMAPPPGAVPVPE
jgi:hypothetical protein